MMNSEERTAVWSINVELLTLSKDASPNDIVASVCQLLIHAQQGVTHRSGMSDCRDSRLKKLNFGVVKHLWNRRMPGRHRRSLEHLG